MRLAQVLMVKKRHTVAAWMTAPPICVEATALVSKARALMIEHQLRHLPVKTYGALVGILSIRDILPVEEDGPVSDVMTRPVQTIEQHVEVSTAAERFLSNDISCLPVVQGDAVVGVLSTSDLLRCAADLLERRRSGSAASVAMLMTARPRTVGPSEPLARGYSVMREGHVRHLPVLQSGRLVGILSDRDVLVAGRTWLSTTPSGHRGLLRVADAMSHPAVTIGTDRPALEAALILEQRRFGALPVMRNEQLVGVVTVADFLHLLVEGSSGGSQSGRERRTR
jgi:CBS domain-containing protein